MVMQKLTEARTYLKSLGISDADAGVVLGTGLHALVQKIEIIQTIPYADIPGFPVSTVEFHKGQLVFGKIKNKKVLVMQGRLHAYEGYSLQQVVFPVRVMKMLGIRSLFLSNAAGGIHKGFKKGDLVLLKDHINLLPGNPLTGPNYDDLGPRFPDMSKPYDSMLNQKLANSAHQLGIEIKQGVYVAVQGPNLETPAEYRYLKIIGADMVGMSTVPEVIACNHMQLPCAAVSVITDECDPDNLQPINIQEIIQVAGHADAILSTILYETIAGM